MEPGRYLLAAERPSRPAGAIVLLFCQTLLQWRLYASKFHTFIACEAAVFEVLHDVRYVHIMAKCCHQHVDHCYAMSLHTCVP